jgi:hypothetical protein
VADEVNRDRGYVEDELRENHPYKNETDKGESGPTGERRAPRLGGSGGVIGRRNTGRRNRG